MHIISRKIYIPILALEIKAVKEVIYSRDRVANNQLLFHNFSLMHSKFCLGWEREIFRFLLDPSRYVRHCFSIVIGCC